MSKKFLARRGSASRPARPRRLTAGAAKKCYTSNVAKIDGKRENSKNQLRTRKWAQSGERENPWCVALLPKCQKSVAALPPTRPAMGTPMAPICCGKWS